MLKILLNISVVAMMLGFAGMSAVSASEIGTSEKIAVSLVIDTSGSMAETDPENLRKTAAEIFVDLLSPEDQVGIVSFATEAIELVPMQQVGDATNKQAIKNALSPIESANGNTNYQLALQTAEQQLDSYTDQDIRKVIIFLTDGVPEPDYVLREDEVFMSAYMEGLWQTTMQIGFKDYAIYSFGFGSADPSALQRIADDTNGEAEFLGSSAEIAVNFFEVLRNLKNRQEFLNETIASADETVLPFWINDYTSQVTLASIYDTGGINISIRSISGIDPGDNLIVQNNENYGIITMNQSAGELSGDWEVVISGNGNVQLFGDKDLTLKSWLIEPQANTQLVMDEPITIKVAVTGAMNEEITVQVIVNKNGSDDYETVPLTYDEGAFTGSYENTDVAGTYLLETQIKDGETLVTSNSATVSVQQLPEIVTDIVLQDEIFKVTESQFITASLALNGNLLDESQGITVSSFNLVATAADGSQGIYPFLDDNPESSGDQQPGDGVYSVVLPFEQDENYMASIVVQGTAEDGDFTIEKDLGKYRIVPSGTIVVRANDSKNITKPGGTLLIPLELKNNSERSEIVTLSLSSKFIVSEEKVITMDAGQTVVMDILVELSDGTPLEMQKIAFDLFAEDPLTQTNSGDAIKVNVVSGSELLLLNIRSLIMNNLAVLTLIVMVPLVTFILGHLLYTVKLKKSLAIPRYLEIIPTDRAADMQKIQLPTKLGKRVISLGSDAIEEGMLLLEGAKIPYLLIVELKASGATRKWLKGFKSLSKSNLPIQILIETTPPGIFRIGGEVFTNKEIFDRDTFESGGYRFTYRAENTLGKENKARNILEGKM